MMSKKRKRPVCYSGPQFTTEPKPRKQENPVPDWLGLAEADQATRTILAVERAEQAQDDLHAAFRELAQAFREAIRNADD